MLFLKQSTAYSPKIGPFLDDSDGKTEETGLTISQADVRLSKNGAAFAQKTESTSCTHDENGWYLCPLDTTDTGTLGKLQLAVHESGALPVWHEFMVVTANVYDTLYSTEKFDVNVAEVSDDSTAANDLELLVENAKGTDHKVLVSADAQDLSATFDVNAKTLGNDAITSAKYDESTAFPVKSDDSGATQIARVGADSDTLETLSDQMDAISDPSNDIWYVSKEGNDANGGHSWGDSLLTIAQTISSATSGDTIHIGPGTYSEATHDLATASKSLRIIGAGKGLTIISASSGKAIILDDDCILMNLSVLATAGLTASDIAVEAAGKDRIKIHNCDMYGSYDGVHITASEDCTITESSMRGKYDGANFTVTGENLIVHNCQFRCYGTFGTTVDGRAMIGSGEATMENCAFYAERADTTAFELAAIKWTDNKLTLNGGVCHVAAGANVTGIVAGIYSSAAGSRILATGFNIETSGAGAGTGPFDLYAANGEIAYSNCRFDTSDDNSGTGTLTLMNIGVAGAALTAVPWNAAWDAEVQSECDDALKALALDHWMSAAITGTDVADNSGLAYLVSKSGTADWDSFVNTTDSLEAIRDAVIAESATVATESAVNDASATTTSFITDLTETTNDHFNNMLLCFTSGNLAGQSRRISDYVGSSKTLTVSPALTEAPADNDTFSIFYNSFFTYPTSGGNNPATYTVKRDDEDTGDPIADVTVWITTDATGNNVIWNGVTDANGVLKEAAGGSKPYLFAGTYYFWRTKAGEVFSNPDTETFS